MTAPEAAMKMEDFILNDAVGECLIGVRSNARVSFAGKRTEAAADEGYQMQATSVQNQS